MSLRPLCNSPSVPYLCMKVPQRKLSFVHLAPIPEVPLAAPITTNHNEVDTLLALIDLVLWGTRDSPVPTEASRLAGVREVTTERDERVTGKSGGALPVSQVPAVAGAHYVANVQFVHFSGKPIVFFLSHIPHYFIRGSL